jgi:hypothetical protein
LNLTSAQPKESPVNDAVLNALSRIASLSSLVQSERGAQELLQDNALFHLAYAKQTRLNDLRSEFGGQHLRTVWISNNVELLADAPWEGEVRALEKNFFQDQDPTSIQKKCADLKRSLVIINNNDTHKDGSTEDLAGWIQRCPDTIFVAWDWDNHHWLSLSYPLAALSDVYCPAHYENQYALSRFNAAAQVVPCGIVQWTSEFLGTRFDALASAVRSDGPLGKHIYYPGFKFRNQVITTLGPKYPDVCFTTHQFHQLTPEEKFLEWAGFKLHLIVPVLNDVPIRMFDAWATGGIPLVPESLRFSPVFSDVDQRDILFYSAADIITPEPLLERGLALFDSGGKDGIRRRHDYGLSRHHGEERIRRMLDAAKQLIGFKWP